MSKKTKTNFISASVKRVRSLTLLVTGGVVMSSMALALLLQDTASSNNENVQVWGVQSRVQYLTGMTLSWANNNHIKFEYKEGTNSLNLNAAVNLHALILGASNSGVTGATVIGGHDNKVQGNWQNAAIIGGSNNTTNDTTSSIIAGSKWSSITKAGESAIFSAQGTIVGGENPTDTVFIVWGQNHSTTNASTVFIAGAEGIQTTKSHNVLIGKNIRSNQSNIFVWSNGNTELTPQKGSAFYVNSTSGFGLNTNNPQAALDIANGGLAFNKVYQLSDLADVKEPWVILMVAKDGKQGICAYNGTTWVPLSLNAEREWLCVGNTQPARPIHVLRESVAISGAVANGSAVLTNGVTSLPQVWSKIANGNRWGWENHPWTYKHTGTLNDGEYRCGIGYHMGNPTPDGMKNTNCSSCTPITNQRDWRSNGKNDDCEFSCKAGFKKVGRSCDTCEVWTYSVNGTTANSCASCTNKPANSHYTSNGTSATSCTWACDAGYHNVGWVCKKAVWKPTVTPTCKAYPGKWKDALKVTTYSCALQEDPSVAVPENICAHWSTKPTNQTVAFADENCNPPEWETNRTCPQPACNLSRLAGKCGGVIESVTCTKHKRDRAWNSYETITTLEGKACTRTCETAACGAANGVATKYQPTTLCAAGTASAVGGNASVWSWTCTQLDGAKNCSANRLPLKGGSCGGVHNTIIKTLPSSNTPNLCEYGTVTSIQDIAWFVRVHPLPHLGRWKWKCRGDAWATNEEVNCFAHAPEPKAGECNLSEVNKCTVGTVEETSEPLTNGTRWKCVWIDGGDSTTCSACDSGYKYNSTTSKCEPKCGAGYTLSNGKCVKRECKKEEKCNCLVSQGRVQVACEGLAPGQEGWCYREFPPIPTITEDTKQQCESKPQCQWREVNRSICVDNNSNKLSDAACSSIGPKESCNRPPTPPTPPPPGPPAQLKINGLCKTHAWTHTSQPATSTANGCIAGDYEDIPDDSAWKWRCKGRNGGTSTECSATKKENPPSPRPGGGGWCNPPCPTWYRCENHYARTQDPGHKYHGGRCVRVAPPHPWPWPHPSQPWDNRRG